MEKSGKPSRIFASSERLNRALLVGYWGKKKLVVNVQGYIYGVVDS